MIKCGLAAVLEACLTLGPCRVRTAAAVDACHCEAETDEEQNRGQPPAAGRLDTPLTPIIVSWLENRGL